MSLKSGSTVLATEHGHQWSVRLTRRCCKIILFLFLFSSLVLSNPSALTSFIPLLQKKGCGQCRLCVVPSWTCEGLSRRLTGTRAYFENTKKCRFPVTAFAPMPQAPDLQNTSDAAPTCIRMPRWNNLLAPQRSNGPQSIPRPNTTKKRTFKMELQRTANQKRATNRRNQKPVAEQLRAHQSEHH